MEQKTSKQESLTWDELADLYDKEHNGRKARTLSMDNVFLWAERQITRFEIDNEGYIYLKVEK